MVHRRYTAGVITTDTDSARRIGQRVRAAYHCLLGHSVAYRLDVRGTMDSTAGVAYVARCIGWDKARSFASFGGYHLHRVHVPDDRVSREPQQAISSGPPQGTTGKMAFSNPFRFLARKAKGGDHR